jgi:hypothetical protein
MKAKRLFCVLCWVVGLSLLAASFGEQSADGQETLPAGLKIVAIEAYPPKIELRNRFDYRQVLITGKVETGETVDLTRLAKLAAPAKNVAVTPMGVVRPIADGEEQLSYTYESHSVSIPVAVSDSKSNPPVSFLRDVQPALSRMGCNQGTCHGAKDGKAGFKLSLRGYDALYDHIALTDDIAARRFNRAAPDQSLMLLKATGGIPHVGGVRTNVGDPYYELVREWIAEGAKLDLGAPRVASVEILPKNPVLPRAGMKQQMVVLATYPDGSVRDVTQEAFIESGNIEAVEAVPGGLLTLLRRGEAPVLVRYDGAYTATTLTVMGDRTGFAWSNPPSNNYVDELVYKKLQRVKILPSDLCTDEEFVRRIYIDLTGLPPTADQVRAFLALPGDVTARRNVLIDQLVGSPGFIEFWTNKWADMLQVNRKFLGEAGAVSLRNWIKESIASNKPYNQLAYEVLTANGSTIENPAAAYFKTLRDAPSLMENTTHLFLAVRFNCNKCHDHPFERWTQDQYYHLTSYFTQIGRKEDPNYAGQRIGGSAVEGATPLVEVIYDTGSGEIKHDRTGQVSPPAFPYQHDDLAPNTASRREQIAKWITSPKNQYFATSYVNRLWGYLFGTGIIEPIDDIRAGNPPTNPELLDALSKDFVQSGFDIQHMIRVICQSRTYQLSIRTNQWNDDDGINFSHATPRRLPAEVLYDAIHLATGSRQKFEGLPEGMRASELPDTGISNPFLEDFGRPVRESSCECERSTGMVLGPIMKLVNGPTVSNAVADPNSELSKLVAAQPDDTQLVREVFLRFVARQPSPDEIKLGLDAMNAAGEGHDKLVAALKAYESELPAKQLAWEQTVGKITEWKALEPVEMKSAVGATFKKLEDQSILASGTNGKDTYTIVAHTDLKDITGVRIEALADSSLPAGGPGRALNGNFVLNELKLTAAPKADPAKVTPASFQNPSADFSQESWNVAGAIDGNEATGWAIMPAFNQSHSAIFETAAGVGTDGGTVLTFSMVQQFQDGTHSLGHFRISVTNSPRPVGMNKLPADLVAALTVPADKRNDEQKAKVATHYQSLDTEYQRLKSEVQRSDEQLKNKRLIGVQDLAWALINSPGFLFNR